MAGRLARAYAVAVVALRWPIALLWIAGAIAAVIALPPLSERSAGSLGSIVPAGSPALAAEHRAADAFGYPLFSRTIVARRDAGGMSRRDQLGWFAAAARLTTGHDRRAGDGDRAAPSAAIPLVNAPALAGSTREHGTAALAYLLFPPSVDPAERADAARALAPRTFGAQAHVTGVVAARLAATDLIVSRLWIVELATGLLVALVVGLHFRAPGAPLAALAAVTVSYLIAARVIPWAGDRLGVAVPREVAPMIVVLLFGALTDYSIFFLSRCRACLAAGESRRDAARSAVSRVAGVITVAAAIVAGTSATLVLADFDFFRAFGPGMAATIAVGWLVGVTFVPALLGIFGRALFWPGRLRSSGEDTQRRRRLLDAIVRHPLPAALVVLVLLGGAAAGLTRLHLANPLLRGLPAGDPAARGYRAIATDFGPGYAAPTLVVVSGRRLDARRAALARFQHALERRPDVTAVLGPGDNPLPGVRAPLVSADGHTARFALVLASDPLGPDAIAAVQDLRGDLAALLRDAGLPRASAGVGGDTALAADTISLAVSDLALVAPAVVAVIFAVLALYLRALVVPALMVAASLLGLAAALGITAYVWTWLTGGALAYYVPFAVAVLLLALGSDYSVLLAGRIWSAAGAAPLGEAIGGASAQAARPIAAAGVVLAASFALLAILPLWEFRQFAMAMTAGLLIDAFLIRLVLVPAVVAFAGRRGAAPASRRAGRR
ncbi:MAG TPA: MMPL family transporter [Solirubrobacteraceae bacterium]|nr:MMPL family transporter [Solirubrobacteraceae bacterium]